MLETVFAGYISSHDQELIRNSENKVLPQIIHIAHHWIGQELV